MESFYDEKPSFYIVKQKKQLFCAAFFQMLFACFDFYAHRNVHDQ